MIVFLTILLMIIIIVAFIFIPYYFYKLINYFSNNDFINENLFERWFCGFLCIRIILLIIFLVIYCVGGGFFLWYLSRYNL
jgi:hypothetical protein